MFYKSILLYGTLLIMFPERTITLFRRIDDSQRISLLRNAEVGLELNEEDLSNFKIWPQGVIPYYIDVISYDKVSRDKIRTHLTAINSQTGVQFTELQASPKDGIRRWVIIMNRRAILECLDPNDKKDFLRQVADVVKVVLGFNCLDSGGAMAAAALAILGVPPQHNAPNRDNHITVHVQNILPGKAIFFKAVTDNDWVFHNLPYDFQSAGHYDFHKYTANGASTIEPKISVDVVGAVGEAKGLSETDILKIRTLYGQTLKLSENSKIDKNQDCSKMFKRGPKKDNQKEKVVMHSNNLSSTSEENKETSEVEPFDGHLTKEDSVEYEFVRNPFRYYKGDFDGKDIDDEERTKFRYMAVYNPENELTIDDKNKLKSNLETKMKEIKDHSDFISYEFQH